MLRTLVRAATVFSALTIAAVACASPAAADGPVCPGFENKNRIGRLGGRAAFSRPGITTVEELQEKLGHHRGELEALMTERGRGHLSDAFFAALDSGRVSERDLARGEIFEWMAFRKRGGPTTDGPMCLASKKTYSAFVIEVEEETSSKKSDPRCSIQAPASGCHDQPVRIGAGGSSAGVEVTTSGPGGSQTIISGGSTTWEGVLDTPGTYTVTAKARKQASATYTNHTFLVPKICLNLAYAGHGAPVERAGAEVFCEETATLEIAHCRQPSCSIHVDPAQIPKKECATISVDGVWDDGGIRVSLADADGNPAKGAGRQPIGELTDFPAEVCIREEGVYTLSGTATKDGDSAPCRQAELEVGRRRGATAGPGRGAGRGPKTVRAPKDGSPWIIRGFLASLSPDDGRIRTEGFRANGDIERTAFKLGTGTGIGAGIEYLFNDRIGLEGSLIIGDFDAEFMLDVNEAWDMDSDSPGFSAFTVGPNFHLAPGKKVDFYLGPFIGIANVGNASFQVLGERITKSLDEDEVFGLQLGLDIPISDGGWGVHLGARVMDLSVEVDDTEAFEIGADPFVATVGFAYRFGGR